MSQCKLRGRDVPSRMIQHAVASIQNGGEMVHHLFLCYYNLAGQTCGTFEQQVPFCKLCLLKQATNLPMDAPEGQVNLLV